MKINLLKTLLTDPIAGWKRIHKEDFRMADCYARYVIPLALIGPVAALIGTTRVGWQVGGSDVVRLTLDSALRMSVSSFFAILMVVFILAKTIHWMAGTYNAEQRLDTCVSLATFSATPLFLTGFAMVYPMPWFVYLLGLPALSYSVALLYKGVPIMMEINKEKAFLFSSAILALGLVSLVGLIAATVSLWGVGFGPDFVTD